MKPPLPDIPATPTARRMAALALIGAGVAAGIGQVVLLRELLNIAAGNELTIGLMLAGWFLWGAVGASLASRWIARIGPTADVMDRVAGLATAPLFVLLIQVDLIRLTPHVLNMLPGDLAVQSGQVMGLPHLVAVSLLAVLLPGTLAGAQFTAAMSLYARLRGGTGAIGRAYAADAVGHLLGGALAALLLLAGWRAHAMAVLAGGASFGLALPLTYAIERGRVRRWLALALGMLVFMGLISWHAITHPLPRLYGDGAEASPLAEIETPHGSLGVVKWGTRGVYFYSNGVPAFPSPPTPQMQHLVHFPMLQAAAVGSRPPARVLLIGGGAAGALREVLQYGPQVRVDYVELDPGLIRLARRYLVEPDRALLDDPRVRVWAMDGRLWVKRRAGGEGYDVVILGVPEPTTAQVNRFYTREFLQEVAAIMAPQGILGLQMPSSETYLGDELLRLNAVLLRTVQSVFPQVALLPGDPMVVAASRDAGVTEDADTLRERMDALRINAPDFRAHAWDRLFPFEVRQVRETLNGAPALPLNTDARPIGYFYGQALWVAQHSRSSWTFFDGLSRLRGRHVLALLVVLCLAGVISMGASRAAARAALPLAVLGTGWVAMALEVTLLFAFQVYYGYVYQQLGIITGAFMVGLASGAMRGGRTAALASPARSWTLMIGAQLALAVEALLLPSVLHGLSGLQVQSSLFIQVLFPLMTALVGLMVGVQFPLAAHLMEATNEAHAGARLYAADLVGACLGAAVAGAMLLPVLGLAGTCVSAAVASGGLAVLLVVARARVLV